MNIVKKVTIILITILLCLPPVGAFAAVAPKLDTTDVLDDLKGMKIGDKAFSVDDYTRSTGAPELIGMYEYGFGKQVYKFNVNADPIDFVPGIHDPDEPGRGGGGNSWLDDLIARIESVVKIVCVVAAIVVVVVVLDKTTAIFDRLFGRRRR